MDVILASANQGKVREVRKIFADTPVLSGCRVLTLADIGFTADIEENGTTFEENALIKARAVADGKHIAIADDSGLEVDALGGAPGVFSARYAGGHGDDDANNRLLLDLMLSAPQSKRISDAFHEDLIRFANPHIDETGITITNWNETKKRMYLEKAYFLLHSAFPFL